MSSRYLQDVTTITTLTKVEIAEYLRGKEAEVNRAMLLREMEDLSKEVKMVEQMKKCAAHDSRMQELLNRFEALKH